MKLVAVLLVSCVLISLLPSQTEIRPWCPSKKQIFGGSCKKDFTQCFDDLKATWGDTGDLGPTDCTCTDQPQDKHLCYCRFLPCPGQVL
ncbi:hypothetical protein EUTSA_v10023863mg [Eutrema salsugineum]|uniref:Uncharacterized protein n=1 Tax=Eutrema salsugineum TaxID=72664 RepID=V4KDY9_EUTSA|nr:hypothetical protein EUTSA_v10023863mg [Eutrema salsugineum]